MKIRYALVMFCVIVCMSGCWGYRAPGGKAIIPPAPRPALIGHIVFVTLNDPAHTDALRYDADYMLGNIPSVSTYASGAHIETGRDTVLDDYDLVIYLGFESREALADYVDHSQHVEFLNKWKPEIEDLRVYDMRDEPNAQSSLGRCGIGGRKKFLGIF